MPHMIACEAVSLGPHFWAGRSQYAGDEVKTFSYQEQPDAGE